MAGVPQPVKETIEKVKESVEKGKEMVDNVKNRGEGIVKQMVEEGQNVMQDILPGNTEPKTEVLKTSMDSINDYLNKGVEEQNDSRLEMACMLFLTAILSLTDDWYTRIRPFKEFIGSFKPNFPNSTNWLSKPKKNLNHFLSNYMLAGLGILFITMLFSNLTRPIGISNFALIISAMTTIVINIVLKIVNKKYGPLVVRGFAITLAHQQIALKVFASPILVHYGILNAIYWTFGILAVFVLSHASLHSNYETVDKNK